MGATARGLPSRDTKLASHLSLFLTSIAEHSVSLMAEAVVNPDVAVRELKGTFETNFNSLVKLFETNFNSLV